MRDDEHELCYGARKRAEEGQLHFPRFVVSHLSFWKQDAEMNVQEIIRSYDALAGFDLAKPRAAPSVRQQPVRAAV